LKTKICYIINREVFVSYYCNHLITGVVDIHGLNTVGFGCMLLYKLYVPIGAIDMHNYDAVSIECLLLYKLYVLTGAVDIHNLDAVGLGRLNVTRCQVGRRTKHVNIRQVVVH
jgi:hypothetical protein